MYGQHYDKRTGLTSMKKWITLLFTAVCLMFPTAVYAADTPAVLATPNSVLAATFVQPATLSSATGANGNTVQVRPIRGSHSFGSRSFGSRSFGSSGSRSFGSRSFGSGSSSSRSGSYSYHRPYSSPFGGFHFGSLMTGFFIARMFNPFGFGYGYGAGLGLFHIVLDIFLIWLAWRIFSRFMR